MGYAVTLDGLGAESLSLPAAAAEGLNYQIQGFKPGGGLTDYDVTRSLSVTPGWEGEGTIVRRVVEVSEFAWKGNYSTSIYIYIYMYIYISIF